MKLSDFSGIVKPSSVCAPLTFLSTFAAILLAIGLGVPILMSLLLLLVIGSDGVMELTDRFRNSSQAAAAPAIKYLESDTVQFLACDRVGGIPRTLARVPWRRRSVRLIFAATKAAVCRPFAR